MVRSGGEFDDIDWLDDDPDKAVATVAPRLPWPRWFTVAAAVLAVAAVVAVLNTVRRTPPPPPAAAASTPVSSSHPVPSRSASSSSAPGTPGASTSGPTRSPFPVSVLRLGHPLLGITGGWEVIARGVDVLARIQPAAGRVTVTTIPDLRSGGPVSLLAGPGQVLIQPWDSVPGYLVPDGRPPRELPLPPDESGWVFPGPEPGQKWVQLTGEHESGVALATLGGKRLSGVFRLPAGASSYQAVADGAGQLLYSAIGGLYVAGPDGLRRISTGSLLAAGPTGWLVVECDEQYRCQVVLIGRSDGSRRVVPTPTGNQDRSGVISPDGASVAMMVGGPSGSATLYLIDLATGHARRIGVSVTQNALEGPIVFSPDSRWLFVVTDLGELSVVDCRTGAVSALGVPLPTLSQLTIRSASH